MILKKRIKRLGMHQVMMQNMQPSMQRVYVSHTQYDRTLIGGELLGLIVKP